jgi:hypothetical protein
MRKLWPTGRAERQALTAVLAVAVLALAGLLVFVAAPGPKSGSVPYELMSVCVQVLGVSIVGFVVGMATFSLQQAHLERQVFSPVDRRVRNVRVARSAAFRVASRRCPGCITIPLPSTLSTSSVALAAGSGVRAA